MVDPFSLVCAIPPSVSQNAGPPATDWALGIFNDGTNLRIQVAGDNEGDLFVSATLELTTTITGSY